jgi:hypothetical protein
MGTKQRQFLTANEAPITRKQHSSPCSDCPWARKSIKGWLGHMSPEDWLQLAHGEGTADCHGTQQANGDAWECAGLAIYRANMCKSVRDPNVRRLPADRITVFATPNEFRNHHGK